MFRDLRDRLPRIGRLEKLFLLLLALNLLAWASEQVLARSIPGGAVLRLAAYMVAVLLAFKLLRLWLRRMLWRVRNRMILLFLFVGLVPLLVVAALVGLAGYLLTGQGAVYMANSALNREASALADAATGVLWSARSDARSEPSIGTLLERLAEARPRLQGLVRYSRRQVTYPPGSTLEPPQPAGESFQGLVRRQDQFYVMARVSGPPGEVILLEPLSEAYLAALAPGLGRISLLPLRPLPRGQAHAGVTAKFEGDRFAFDPAVPAAAQMPPASNALDRAVAWLTLPFRVRRWGPSDPDVPVILLIETRPSAVFRLLFGQQLEAASGVAIGFIFLGVVFLVVELVSLVVGVSLTRTVTNSVHDLYEGTQKVNRGDFSHRIRIVGHDQLTELSGSFNSMTASIERLIEESKEKQKLESELAIAREVQEQLFPKAPPEMRNLEILGFCSAARMVSGDYYDFVKMSEERLALAIGDVAGKGISGALLMASIQSMLRTQLSATAGAAHDDTAWRFPTAALVSQLNLQLYHNTTPEKYATFFFGAYDDRHALLTYTNAGHLPPVLIRNGEPRRLDVNGMVVGAFAFAQYEQSEIELHAGDVLVAFTDGVSEPENEFAEEFGEDRLIELLVRHWRRTPREMIDAVIAAVGQWTGRPELQDDLTLLVARRL